MSKSSVIPSQFFDTKPALHINEIYWSDLLLSHSQFKLFPGLECIRSSGKSHFYFISTFFLINTFPMNAT